MGAETGFRFLVGSNLLAQSAEQIALAAAPLVAVLALGAGAVETGSLQVALTLPFLIFAIPAGLLADRYSRRPLMIVSELVRFASLTAILVFSLLGQLSWPLLALLGFFGVCGTVLFSVAAPALVPDLAPPYRLAAANARIELARTTALTAGPAVGGVLVTWLGAPGAFGIAAALSLAAAGLLTRLVEPIRAPSPQRRPIQEVKDGMAFVFGHSLLAPIFATQFVFNVGFFIILAVFVPHAVTSLGLSASAIGVTLALFGFGMIIGALLAPRVMRGLRLGIVVAVGPLSGLLGSLLIATTIWLPIGLLAGAGFFLLGLGPILWVISTTTLRQTVTPAGLLGRVSAINVLAYGARPIGAGLGALISGYFSVEVALLAACLLFSLQAVIISLSPVVRLSHQPELAIA
jgi:predicted MFS family arabinose efflux permease